MSSEIKVDTISENTSANGVAIDSLGIKDGKVTNLMNATLSAADLGGGVHIKTADASVSAVNSAADELVLENSASCGLSIFSGTGEVGKIAFGDSGDNNQCELIFNHTNNQFTISSNGGTTQGLHVYEGAIGSNEAAPDISTGGLCLNQSADDDFIMTFKSSDVAHGITSTAQADTYGSIQKANSSNGGLSIFGLCDAGTTGVEIQSYFESVNTSKASNANVPIKMITRARNGTSSTAPSNVSANSNLFGVASGTSLRFIVDSDGDLHVDGSTSISAFDNYEDAQLVRAYDLSHGKGVIDSKFDKFIAYNHESLADAKLVGRDDDGTPNHFINMTGMQRLHNGAIWQQYEKHQKLANAMYELAKAAVGEDKANEILEQNDIKLLN